MLKEIAHFNNKKEEHMSSIEINNSWEKSQNNELIAALRAGKDLAETVYAWPDFKEAFSGELDEIDCSDGRVLGEGKKIGVAGQGILASEEDRLRLVKACRGRVKCVTSHDDCGAAALKYKELLAAGESMPDGVETADELGKTHAKRMAAEIGAAHKHIGADKLLNSFHNERAICFDGTGRFNVAALKEMPARFVTSAPGFGLSDEYSRAELETLAGIALGNHGFGSRFDEKNPFYIIVSAKTPEQLSHLTDLAEKATAQFKNRVVVKGFVYGVSD